MTNPLSKLDIDEIIAAAQADDNRGFCRTCGECVYGVEPDARNYKCESCGSYEVFGAEELILEGLL